MRRSILLMNDWLFKYKNNDFINVNLPHTWNNIDGQDGGNDYYRGKCIYQKEFIKPDFEDNEEIYLQFDGVNSSCSVYLNDKKLITHNGGYSTFRVKITNEILDNNILILEVDNKVNDRVYPQRADFTFYGGIYRNVSLLIVNKKHFELDYYGGLGVKYYTKINKDEAYICTEAFANSDNIVIELKDKDKNVVALGSGKKATLNIKNPILWDGVINPYLYTLTFKIIENNNLLDEVSVNCGIREFYIDSNKGFFLNGRSYPLHGVSKHQDFKKLGNAIDEKIMINDMELIKELGANTIRLAHYQHNQYFYDLCDKNGMIVWAEIPYISEHLVNGNDNTISQMKELIIQNYNHPSICMWGISNEITIKDNHRKEMINNHKNLNRLCKKLDPNRLTTIANYAMCAMNHPVTKITDLVGWNLYLGWYVPGFILNDLWIRFYHLINKNRPLSFSEYGAEGMPNLHSKHPKRGDHSEEYQSKYHEYMLRCLKKYPFMWGTYVWNMFDFAADARNQGGEPGMNHKGLVTFDRKIKKDSFYLYKAYWSNEPFIHICSKRYANREGKSMIIKIYTNMNNADLYVNGNFIKTLSGEKVLKCKIKMSEVNKIKVISNGISDNAIFYMVKKKDKNYILSNNKSQNWI